jgi:hypothetical protein
MAGLFAFRILPRIASVIAVLSGLASAPAMIEFWHRICAQFKRALVGITPTKRAFN